MPGMRKRRDGSDHQLPSLRDAYQPEHPQIPNLRRLRLAHHRDMGAVCCLYGDAPHLHVHLSGLIASIFINPVGIKFHLKNEYYSDKKF